MVALSSHMKPSPPSSTASDRAPVEQQLGWKLELHEIGNQIQLAQMQNRNILAVRLGLPRRTQQDDYYTATIHLDACLNKWQSNLPNDWELENVHKINGKKCRAERYILHLR